MRRRMLEDYADEEGEDEKVVAEQEEEVDEKEFLEEVEEDQEEEEEEALPWTRAMADIRSRKNSRSEENRNRRRCRETAFRRLYYNRTDDGSGCSGTGLLRREEYVT